MTQANDMTTHTGEFFIGGAWVAPATSTATHPLVDPSTGVQHGTVALGNGDDVNAAVAAAKAAFPTYSQSTVAERTALIERILGGYMARVDDFARAISLEIGAPAGFASALQAPVAAMTMQEMLRTLGEYPFEQQQDGMTVVREPIGVCALIAPWNWPMHQVVLKVIPALAAGCTMILKPSENTPISALILAEVFDAAGVPAGVFNLVNGNGPDVGRALAQHPDIAMISFTGSTRAGVQVAKDSANTIKRVTQELGGKSANIILPDADLDASVRGGVAACMANSGQSCNAPTRMLVPAALHDDAVAIAAAAADAITVGRPNDEGAQMGPIANEAQFEKVRSLIQVGIDEGATLVAGGPDRPAGLDDGFFIRPTVFGNVSNDMRIAQEEIFGPVLCILPYEDLDEAVAIANDSPFGLSGYVQSGDPVAARKVASRLRTGNVMINGANPLPGMPFGGFKQSGNGREWSHYGLEEFLEIKAIVG